MGGKETVSVLFLDRIVTRKTLPPTRNLAVEKLQQSKSLRVHDLEAKCFRFVKYQRSGRPGASVPGLAVRCLWGIARCFKRVEGHQPTTTT